MVVSFSPASDRDKRRLAARSSGAVISSGGGAGSRQQRAVVYVSVCVADTGGGIPPDQQHQLLQPFAQARVIDEAPPLDTGPTKHISHLLRSAFLLAGLGWLQGLRDLDFFPFVFSLRTAGQGGVGGQGGGRWARACDHARSCSGQDGWEDRVHIRDGCARPLPTYPATHLPTRLPNYPPSTHLKTNLGSFTIRREGHGLQGCHPAPPPEAGGGQHQRHPRPPDRRNPPQLSPHSASTCGQRQQQRRRHASALCGELLRAWRRRGAVRCCGCEGCSAAAVAPHRCRRCW